MFSNIQTVVATRLSAIVPSCSLHTTASGEDSGPAQDAGTLSVKKINGGLEMSIKCRQNALSAPLIALASIFCISACQLSDSGADASTIPGGDSSSTVTDAAISGIDSSSHIDSSSSNSDISIPDTLSDRGFMGSDAASAGCEMAATRSYSHIPEDWTEAEIGLAYYDTIDGTWTATFCSGAIDESTATITVELPQREDLTFLFEPSEDVLQGLRYECGWDAIGTATLTIDCAGIPEAQLSSVEAQVSIDFDVGNRVHIDYEDDSIRIRLAFHDWLELSEYWGSITIFGGPTTECLDSGVCVQTGNRSCDITDFGKN